MPRNAPSLPLTSFSAPRRLRKDVADSKGDLAPLFDNLKDVRSLQVRDTHIGMLPLLGLAPCQSRQSLSPSLPRSTTWTC